MEKLRFLGARVLRLVRPYRISLVFVGAVSWRLVRPGRGRVAQRDGTRPHEILVVRLDAIGDLVMSSLVFRELRLRFPGSRITAVVQEQCRPLLENSPYVDRVVCPPRFKKSFFFHGLRQDLSVVQLYRQHLQGQAFDLVVNPRLDGDLYSADVLLELVDAAQTFKYEEISKKGLAGKINQLAFRRAVRLKRPAPRHEVLNNITMIETITGVTCTSRPEVFFTEQDIAHRNQLFAKFSPGTAIICIAFGAQAMRRVWPIERWAETIALIALQRPVFALIACTNSEASTGSKLQAMLSTPSHLLKGATLRQVAADIRSCDLFIGPDSGLAHLAAAVDCPSVIVSPHPLNGSPDHGNSPLRFGPFADHVQVIQPEEGLAPCLTGCDAIAPHCILQVLPLQVAEACLALLEEGHMADGGRLAREVRSYSKGDIFDPIPESAGK